MSREWWQNISADIHTRLQLSHITEQDTMAEVVFIIENAPITASGTSKVLDLACGSGRHSLELARRGHHVIGLDYTRSLLTLAKERARGNPNFVQGNMLTLPFPAGSFDLIISMWHSLGYFQRETDNEQVFFEISRVLRRRGVCVLQLNSPFRTIADMIKNGSVVNAEGRLSLEQNELFETETIEKSSSFDPKTSRYKSRRIYEKNGQRVEVTHDMRYYTLPELEKILSRYGLVFKEVFGSVNKEPYDFLSKNIVIVAQKIS